MEVSSMHLLMTVLVISHLTIPASLQRVQGRHLRPYNVPKCDRYGRCSGQDGYDETARDDFKSDQDKDHIPELSRDDWPIPPAGRPDTGIDTKPDAEDYDPKVTGTGSSRHVPKPVADRDDYDIKPVGNGGGGNNRKPDRDEYNPKPVVTGVGGGYNLKLDSGNPPGTAGGGYNRRPGINPKPVVTGGGGGGYNRKPVGGGGLGGYNPKPVADRDEVDGKPFVGGGGYIPKPVDDRDDYDPKPVGDDYNPKPVGGGGGGYNPKPNRGGGGGGGGGSGYYPRPVVDEPHRRPDRKEDLGGYEKPKADDYNDDYDDGIKDDYGGGLKPEHVVDGKCYCVPYYQCLEGHIVTDGSGIIDARKRPEPDEELPLDGKFKPPSCGPFHVCCNTPETSTVKPYEHRCGVRNPSGINSRILSPSNKGEADFGEWPWQAAVLKAEGKVNIFQCGGVIIDKYHVLTVAHCVFHLYKYNEYPLKVRLGEWDTQTTTEFLAHEDYKVSKIIVHPEFRNTSLWNDIAILRLEDPVLFAPHIDTICLPQYDEIFADQNCVVTGWGKDAYKGGSFSNVMKEVALQVIDNYKCEEMLRKTRLGGFFQLHEGFLCAGGEYGLDSCKGDGGGPLVCYRKDKSYALAGIVSWGIDCGQPGVPGVYVKIQKYLEWISKSTGVSLQEYWPKH